MCEIDINLHSKLTALIKLGEHLGMFGKDITPGAGLPNPTEHPPETLAKDDPLRIDVMERFERAAEKWSKRNPQPA